jgi:hypothetical protein
LGASSSSGLPIAYRVVSGPASVSNNIVTFSGLGSVVIAADQPGNGNFTPASEVTNTFNVAQGTQTITWPTISDVSYGATLPLTASSSSGLPPSYRVISGPATISNSILIPTGAGKVVLAANQSGNANYSGASEVTTSFIVGQGSQTLNAFTTISSQTYSNGATVTITAPAASSSLPVTVTVKSGPATISGNTVTLTGAGTVVLAADQAGNTNYLAAPQVTTSFSVAQGNQTITFGALTNRTYGNAPFTLNATASSGLPVSYGSRSTNIAINSNTLTILGAGTATITASQSGNTNWSAATPLNQNLVIAQASNTINAFATIPSQMFSNGATVTITAPAASSSLPVTVTVKSGPATISGNTVTLTGAGTVVLAADQAGNTNYLAAPQVTTSFSVAQGNQTITFGALTNRTYGNAPFTLNATASSGLPVSYGSRSTNIAINSNTLTILGAGTATITASQSGNTNWSAATPLNQNLVIAQASNTINAFATIPSQTYSNGASVTITPPAATSSLPVTVTVKSGPATINGNTVTLTGAGTVVLAADQAGNTNYLAASEVTTSFSVGAGSQAVTFPAIANQPISTNPIILNGSASSGLPVSYSVLSGAASLTSSNALALNGIGTITVQASQSGNSNWNAATPVRQSFVVSKGSQTISFAPFPTNTYGQSPYQLTNASASSGLPVSYTSSATGVATIMSNTLTIVGAGTTTITATQSGNTNWNAASSITQTLVLVKATNSITSFTPIPNSNYVSNGIVSLPQPLPVASSGLPVTLSVKSGPAVMSGANAIMITGAGAVVMAADQAGNANYLGAPQVTTSFQILQATQSLAAFTTIPNKTNGVAPFAVTLPKASSGLPVSLSVLSGPASVSNSIVTLTGAGSVTLAANQSGNTNYLAAPQVTTSFGVAKGSQTITFATLASVTTGTTPFKLGATASSGLPVTYNSASTNITLLSNTVTILGAGTATITAIQNGNTNWNAATNVTRTLVVTAPISMTNTTTNQITGIGQTANIPTIAIRSTTFPLMRPLNFGSVVAWGDNTYGETNLPVGLTNIVQLSTWGLHSLALKTNGSVAAWGWNVYGQTNVPTSVTNAAQVAAGVSFSAALSTNGTIIAWGDNSLGQTNVPAGLTNALQIAAGSDHAIALRSDGTVTGWGWNAYGQCDIPSDATNVVQIAAGYFHSAALKANGTVEVWGDNTYGETNVPGGLTNVVRIATGLSHTVALKGNGTVVVWGWNNAGQTNVPAGLAGVTQIASGGNTVFAVTTNGTLITWGDNSYGQRKPPTGLSNVMQFVIGLYHALGLKH